jgi:hypothetical protein
MSTQLPIASASILSISHTSHLTPAAPLPQLPLFLYLLQTLLEQIRSDPLCGAFGGVAGDTDEVDAVPVALAVGQVVT